jgi:hypothetical protein
MDPRADVDMLMRRNVQVPIGIKIPVLQSLY